MNSFESISFLNEEKKWYLHECDIEIIFIISASIQCFFLQNGAVNNSLTVSHSIMRPSCRKMKVPDASKGLYS